MLPKARHSALLALAILSGLAVAGAQDRGLQPSSLTVGEAAGRTIYGGSFALLIGAQYSSAAWPALRSVSGELATLRAALEAQGFEVTIPPAAEMSGSRLRQEVLRFISQYGLAPDNRVLIFFAGHGYTREHADRERGYLVPSDAPDPATDMAGFVYSAISMDEVQSWAKMIESKHALFVFDSCFSGSIFRTRGVPVPKYLAAQLAQPVREFLTAGSASETVPAESIFLPLFVRGLSGEADADCDGFVTATEVYSWVSRHLADYEVRQTPQFGKIRDPQLDRGEFLFPLSRLASHCATPPAAAASVAGTLEDEFWTAISGGDEPRLYRHYLARVREGTFAGKYTEAAERKLKEIERKASPGGFGGIGRISGSGPKPRSVAFDTGAVQSRLRRNLAHLIATSSPPREGLSVDLQLVAQEDGTASAERRVLRAGDRISFKAINVGTVPATVTLFFVDSAGGVSRIPWREGRAAVLQPQAAIDSLTAVVTADTAGTEEAFLVATDAGVNLESVLTINEGKPGSVQVLGSKRRYVARVVSWFTSPGQRP